MTHVRLSDLPPRLQKQALEQIAKDEELKTALIEEGEQNSKYHSSKTSVILGDGSEHTFDSKKEADTYFELELRQKAGEINNLRMQVEYLLIPKQILSNGKTERACKYFADFVYEEDGMTIVVDVKSPATRTPTYKIKRKLMKYIHNIEIKEV